LVYLSFLLFQGSKGLVDFFLLVEWTWPDPDGAVLVPNRVELRREEHFLLLNLATQGLVQALGDETVGGPDVVDL
jgi:hypothetical protein